MSISKTLDMTRLTPREEAILQTAYEQLCRRPKPYCDPKFIEWIVWKGLTPPVQRPDGWAIEGITPEIPAETNIFDRPAPITKKNRKTERQTPSHLHIEQYHDVQPKFDRLGLVEGLLDQSAMSVLYGESNTGKTFIALDLLFHIAAGRRWFDRDVERGLAVYIAAEGGYGIRNRIVALRKKYDLAARLALIPCPVDLSGDGVDVQPLLDLIAPIGRPSIIAIDTLSRALSGGNENASEDMGAYIKNVDRLRTATKAHVLTVHHSGKDTAKGARGHSSLRAATDTELEIIHDQKTGERKILTRKQRDMEAAHPIGFGLERVEIGQDAKGRTVTSCIVVPRALGVTEAFTIKLSRGARRALTVLEDLTMGTPAANVEVWRDTFCQAHYPDSTYKVSWQAFKRAYEELQEAGYVEESGGNACISSKSSNIPNEDK